MRQFAAVIVGFLVVALSIGQLAVRPAVLYCPGVVQDAESVASVLQAPGIRVARQQVDDEVHHQHSKRHRPVMPERPGWLTVHGVRPVPRYNW